MKDWNHFYAFYILAHRQIILLMQVGDIVFAPFKEGVWPGRILSLSIIA